MIKNRTFKRHHHKCETDRYDYEWREVNSGKAGTSYKRVIWPCTPTLEYDQNHIDHFFKRDNDVDYIVSQNESPFFYSKIKNTPKREI